MKKLLSMLLVLTMLLSASAVLAEGMGVQVIGGPAVEAEPVSLDDFKLNAEVVVEGYGKLTGTSFEIVDKLGYFRQSYTYVKDYANDYYFSGNEAEYIVLRLDIVNTATTAQDFLAQCEVKAVYDDIYEYGGWYYQSNYNNSSYNGGPDANNQSTRWAIHETDRFAIDPMYKGHYIFGATLPNAVIEAKEPLQLIINIGGNEIIYNVRK